MALLGGLLVLSIIRLGWRKTLALAVVAAPAIFLVFGGRQTDFSTGSGTSQERVRLWSEGFAFFQESPLFGIGQGAYVDRAGLVAHNSFLHSFAEMGVVGGMAFVGAFFCSLYGCWRLGRSQDQLADPDLRQLRPYILAIVTAYAVGLMSLTRVYVVPTYLILGLGAAFLRLAAASGPFPGLRLNGRLALQIAGVSGLILLCIYVGVRVLVNRS
jgi:O-antigen ligase